MGSRRYLAVWLRWLPADRLARRVPALADAPLALIAPVKSALRLTAVNARASRLGLKLGMALADARAMYPSLHVEDADPAADHRVLESIADWCDRYTPMVGLDAPDGILLDITGCVHLFGGEAAMCRDIVMRLSRQGFSARAAVADTVGAAWAAAHYAPDSIIPKDVVREALAPLPLAALRLDAETVLGLGQAGLERIAHILDRPRAPLAARFGAHLVRRIDQALGHEDEPIEPRLPLPLAMAEKRFPDPIAREEDVLGTVEHLAREISRLLERRGEGARKLQLALFRADGKVMRLVVGTAAPLRDPVRMRRLFVERLSVLGDEYDPGFGFDMIRLSVGTNERMEEKQAGLAGPDHDADLAHLVDRLGARFGQERIGRIVEHDTHIPEHAAVVVPAHRKVKAPAAPAIVQDSLAPVRPLRLFARPELLSDAIAEVPDGPPVRFRWRRVLHDVAFAEGPERIAMEWWRNDRGSALTRDYFRIETRAGARIWLYREGLFGREIEMPRWFVHGVFA
jgi:protein ImuB